MRRLALILASMAVTGAAVTPAMAACPTRENAGRGFALTEMDGRTSLRVRALPDDRLLAETMEGDRIVRTMIYARGLFPLTSTHGDVVTTYQYEGTTTEFRLRPGDRASYVATARTPGKPDHVTTVEMTVKGTEEVAIGDCRYPVVVIERRNSYSSGPPNLVLAFFSPELNVPLRTRIRWADGRQRDHEYRAIATIGD